MRVVAGELRGRGIAGPGRGNRVRPTADRVREALFSILGELTGARVLDLFCGTGALGIEAVSRGAGKATLVDLETELAGRNVKLLGIEERCVIARSDALEFLRGPRVGFDLVFCDPPYSFADHLEAELDQLLPDQLAAGARVVVETRTKQPLRLSLPLTLERAYGETLICIYGSGEPARRVR